MRNFKTAVSRKLSTPIFPKNEHFLTSDGTCTCAYQGGGGGKKLTLFGKIGLLSFLEHPFGDSPFFPYYQRYVQFTSSVQGVDLRLVCLGVDAKGNNGTKWVYWNDIFKWMVFSGFNY